MRISVLVPVVALTLLSGNVPARAVLIDSTAGLTNPSFESPALALYTDGGLDKCNYQPAMATGWSGGWTEPNSTSSNSLRHYRPGTNGLKSNGGYFYDPTDGVNGAAIILRSTTVTEGWQYQSLGTVTAEDVGKLIQAKIDTSIRDGMAPAAADMTISFRSGVSSGRNGSIGVLESLDLTSNMRLVDGDDPFLTITEQFQPDVDDIGKEISLVFSVADWGGDSSYANGQYQFDNARLTVVPEPGTVCLLGVGLLGLLGCARRRRRG